MLSELYELEKKIDNKLMFQATGGNFDAEHGATVDHTFVLQIFEGDRIVDTYTGIGGYYRESTGMVFDHSITFNWYDWIVHTENGFNEVNKSIGQVITSAMQGLMNEEDLTRKEEFIRKNIGLIVNYSQEVDIFNFFKDIAVDSLGLCIEIISNKETVSWSLLMSMVQVYGNIQNWTLDQTLEYLNDNVVEDYGAINSLEDMRVSLEYAFKDTSDLVEVEKGGDPKLAVTRMCNRRMKPEQIKDGVVLDEFTTYYDEWLQLAEQSIADGLRYMLSE